MRAVHTAVLTLGVTVLCLSAGCLGRSPEVRHFTMSSIAPATAKAPINAPAIGLGPVSFARHLERPQMLTSASGSEIVIDEFNRWAGGLEPNVVRTLADNLALRLDTRIVVARGGAALPIRYQVALDVDELLGRPGDRLELRARWTILETDGDGAWSNDVKLTEPVEGKTIEDLVRAHDAAIGQLADLVAAQLSSIAR